MCLACEHTEAPEGGFQASYVVGFFFGVLAAQQSPGVVLHVTNGLCTFHRKVWDHMQDGMLTLPRPRS